MNLSTAFQPAVTHRLANGTTLILHPISVTDAVTVDVWVRTGGRNESDTSIGISHFLEHMVFKGTPTLAPGMLDAAIESRGGIVNAATGQDYTHYYITVAAQDLGDTLPHLADAVLNAAIPESEYEREYSVILEEIRRAEDNPDYVAYHLLLSQVYPSHPYGRPVLGTSASLESMTPESLRHYHHQWYQPEHMTVVVVGQIDVEATLALVERCFGTARDVAPSSGFKTTPLLRSKSSRVEQTYPRLEQARLIMAWPTVSVQKAEVACGLELIASILGDGRTSRLVYRLREQLSWVRGIGCASLIQQDSGLFYVSAYLDPTYLEVVEETVLAELRRLQDELISDAELERTRRVLSNEFLFSTESPGQLAHMFGYHDAVAHWCGYAGSGMDLAQRYLDLIQTLSPEKLQNLVQAYLSPEDYTLTVLKPTSTTLLPLSSKQVCLKS